METLHNGCGLEMDFSLIKRGTVLQKNCKYPVRFACPRCDIEVVTLVDLGVMMRVSSVRGLQYAIDGLLQRQSTVASENLKTARAEAVMKHCPVLKALRTS